MRDNQRQNLLILYLHTSALDSKVVAWTQWDGTGRKRHMAGDASEPPYPTGLDALEDGWRLIQMSPLLPHMRGDEFALGYLKYEYLFERIVDLADGEGEAP